MADVIDIKVTCAECDGALVLRVKNGIANFAQIEVIVQPCHSCQEDLKENLQGDLVIDLENLKEKIRSLLDE